MIHDYFMIFVSKKQHYVFSNHSRENISFLNNVSIY